MGIFSKKRPLMKVFGSDLSALVQYEKKRRDRLAFKKLQREQGVRRRKPRNPFKDRRPDTSVLDLVPYMEAVNGVPEIIQFLCDAMNKRPASQGLFREPGSMARINPAIARINESRYDDNLRKLFDDMHPNDLASMLKKYLRMLPNPLLTHELYHSFLDIPKKYDRARDQILALRELVRERLPVPHTMTLEYLVKFFHRVASIEKYGMDLKNLATCLGPTLLSPPPPPKSSGEAPPSATDAVDAIQLERTMGNVVVANGIVLFLFENAHLVFGEDTLESEEDESEDIGRSLVSVEEPEISDVEPQPEPEPEQEQEPEPEQEKPPSPKKIIEPEEVKEVPRERDIVIVPFNASVQEDKPQKRERELYNRSELDELRRQLEQENRRLHSVSHKLESNTVAEFKAMRTRIDNIEHWIQQRGFSVRSFKAEIKKFRADMSQFREKMIYAEQSMQDHSERVGRMTEEYKSCMTKVEDLLRHETHRQVRTDFEIDHLKRIVEQQSAKIRDLTLELGAVRARIDSAAFPLSQSHNYSSIRSPLAERRTVRSARPSQQQLNIHRSLPKRRSAPPKRPSAIDKQWSYQIDKLKRDIGRI